MTEENPFTIDPIKKEKEFIGREDLISNVKDLLLRGKNCHIIGERKSGKTSFLYRIAEEYKREGDPKFAFLDMLQLDQDSPEEVLGKIANCIDADASRKEMEYEEFQDFIRDKKVILAFDEISALFKNEKIDSGFFKFLRAVSDNSNVVFLTTHREGLCKIEMMYPTDTSPFSNMFRSFRLGYFTEGESKELIRKGGEEFLKNYGKWIVQRTYHHPFLLQLVCLKLFKYYKKKKEYTESIFLNTEEEAYEVLESHLKYWYEKSSEEEKRILGKIVSREEKGILGKINSGKGRISKNEESTAFHLQMRLLVYKSKNRYHLVSPFFEEIARENIPRILLENIADILNRMILSEVNLPSKFGAEHRKDRIKRFIEKTEDLSREEGYCIDKFISFDEVLRDELTLVCKDIMAYVGRFVQNRDKPPIPKQRPMNIFIQAPPGSGKSFLVESFIGEVTNRLGKDKVYFPFSEINLSNITSYSELVTFLDTVKLKGNVCRSIPFVLFDEIDAGMPGFNFYQRMLMPMWDGAYLKEGEPQELPPAIFFFAGTPEGLRSKAKSSWYKAKCFRKDIGNGFHRFGTFFPEIRKFFIHKEIDIEQSRTDWRKKCYDELKSFAKEAAVPKFLDFYERIDRFIFLPPLTLYFRKNDCRYKLYFADHEMIYFFAAKIQKTFPKVEKISKAALAFLCNNFYRSKREMERAIFLSHVKDESKIYTFESIPKELKSSLSQKESDEWNKEFDGEIRIKKTPANDAESLKKKGEEGIQ